MPVVQSNSDENFTITLPEGASEAQRQLKARFEGLREALINKKEGLPEYRPLLRQLRDAAILGFDGADGRDADPIEAVALWGAIQESAQRLDARSGRFVIELPESHDQNLGRDIVFNVISASAPVPPEQLQLKAEIEDILTTLQVILPGNSNCFEQYRTKLFSLAQVGLQGDADPKAARQALSALQTEILTREGPRVKNGYMKVLGTCALSFGLIAALIYLATRWWSPHDWLLFEVRNIFVLLFGTMIGTWLSFGVRRGVLTMRDLSNLESDMVEPAIRLVFTGLIAGTIGLIFICKMVNVDIGGLKSVNVLLHGSQALLIGILLGVSEQALPGALTRRASQFVTDIGGRA